MSTRSLHGQSALQGCAPTWTALPPQPGRRTHSLPYARLSYFPLITDSSAGVITPSSLHSSTKGAAPSALRKRRPRVAQRG